MSTPPSLSKVPKTTQQGLIAVSTGNEDEVAWVPLSVIQGSGTSVTNAYPFTYNTSGLSSGIDLYTPTPGDILLDAWIEVDTAWNGTTPLADIGFFSVDTYGLFYIKTYPYQLLRDMTAADGAGPDNPTSSGYLMAMHSLTYSVYAANSLKVTPNFYGTMSTLRVVPGKFTTDTPIGVIVNQTGTKGGASSGATQGEAIFYITTTTPTSASSL